MTILILQYEVGSTALFSQQGAVQHHISDEHILEEEKLN